MEGVDWSRNIRLVGDGRDHGVGRRLECPVIVSELVSWGNKTLKADGLGSFIAEATARGDWPRIVLGVGLMSIFVVTLNRLVWRPLYNLAEHRYRLG